jgi:hypothetical protein
VQSIITSETRENILTGSFKIQRRRTSAWIKKKKNESFQRKTNIRKNEEM